MHTTGQVQECFSVVHILEADLTLQNGIVGDVGNLYVHQVGIQGFHIGPHNDHLLSILHHGVGHISGMGDSLSFPHPHGGFLGHVHPGLIFVSSSPGIHHLVPDHQVLVPWLIINLGSSCWLDKADLLLILINHKLPDVHLGGTVTARVVSCLLPPGSMFHLGLVCFCFLKAGKFFMMGGNLFLEDNFFLTDGKVLLPTFSLQFIMLHLGLVCSCFLGAGKFFMTGGNFSLEDNFFLTDGKGLLPTFSVQLII